MSETCHADTILDHIITQMDEKGISDKKLRKAVAKVKGESVPKMKEDAMIPFLKSFSERWPENC